MLKPVNIKPLPKFVKSIYLCKAFHSSCTNAALKLKDLSSNSSQQKVNQVSAFLSEEVPPPARHVKRNDLGVQLLSRKLHAQVFKGVSFPAPPRSFVQISKEHLELHGLDPTQGSTLPDTGFDLPPLQGRNISEHFYRIGSHAAEPWLSLAKTFAATTLPPKPDNWLVQSGWTKYYYLPDGSSYSEHVETPGHNGIPEEMLTFDAETMPKYHPYAIMACAASPNAWYAWISPWLLGESQDPDHLIPLGNSNTARILVGHNVSYDRIRILEEYNLSGTANRFIDTMSLHVAVNGISSHQRPAWMKYRKAKQMEIEQADEAMAAVKGIMETIEEQLKEGGSVNNKDDIHRLMEVMDEIAKTQVHAAEDNGGATAAITGDIVDIASEEISSKRWEEITSANSLADVAKLHCGIEVAKEIRNDLMIADPDHIRENISDFLDYCANDVFVTHQVYAATLPAFLVACPHPVSFAGILSMGSSFLSVDERWEEYLQNAESVYKKMEEKVQVKLKKLAEDARQLMDDKDKWAADPWLCQLDWTSKVAGKSRGVFPPTEASTSPNVECESHDLENENFRPRWYTSVVSDPWTRKTIECTIPLLLKITYDDSPIYLNKEGWHYTINGESTPVSLMKGRKTKHILSKNALKLLSAGTLKSPDLETVVAFCKGDDDRRIRIIALADSLFQLERDERENDPWLSQLDWEIVPQDSNETSKRKKTKKEKTPKPPKVYWPKWYWEATKPKKGVPPGTLEVTVRTRIAPILLRLSWLGYPLFFSREHGWTFRVPSQSTLKTRLTPVSFYDAADDALAEASLSGGYIFYKLPHKDGEKANVANPLGKTFVIYAQNGTLKSPGDEAKEALDLNSLCSYWISARDRIQNQLVVYQTPKLSLGFPTDAKRKYGVILPQMITMGTVTRRAIEKTWLTASNAKKNRVGSELKAMVRAPEGYAIVGADVDSEELWISSCMGDAQFGLHGASAIGWMTLEGTKAAGTDLHSKTASILGISRDQAKVFNYSRIYGAGMRHAVLLLLQSNPSMLPEEAQKLAENLYSSTKGKNTHRTDIFDRKFWFGGTESYLFNKLEEIATSDNPQTPALGCGVTYALSKDYLPQGFGSDYMPSRINWVVQSSGVDYLHLLIVSMNHLIAKYSINARYLISVHDELRYLVAEEDKYRAALALQIANLWTRSLFAYKLGMDDLPQGVAFFSAIDVDTVLRKEVDMPCVTPSQPIPIPPGESLDISKVLEKTNGSLLKDYHLKMTNSEQEEEWEGTLEGYTEPNCLSHRAANTAFLKAQAATDFGEVKGLAQQVSGKRYEGGMRQPRTHRKKPPISSGEGVDWLEHVERILA